MDPKPKLAVKSLQKNILFNFIPKYSSVRKLYSAFSKTTFSFSERLLMKFKDNDLQTYWNTCCSYLPMDLDNRGEESSRNHQKFVLTGSCFVSNKLCMSAHVRYRIESTSRIAAQITCVNYLIIAQYMDD